MLPLFLISISKFPALSLSSYVPATLKFPFYPQPVPSAMSSFRQVIYQGKTIVVSVANMVYTGRGTSFYRPLAALDQNLVDQALQRTEEAIKTPGVVPGDEAARLSRILLT